MAQTGAMDIWASGEAYQAYVDEAYVGSGSRLVTRPAGKTAIPDVVRQF